MQYMAPIQQLIWDVFERDGQLYLRDENGSESLLVNGDKLRIKLIPKIDYSLELVME